MRLDRTRIAIRERSYPEILDLTLRVIRAHAGPLFVALVVGALPMLALNYALLGERYDDAFFDPSPSPEYYWYLGMLMTIEAPLATSFVTLYLGQALFERRPSPRRIVAEWFRSLPQMILLQVVMRALLVLMFILILPVYAFWPYVNEVILLERNGLFSTRRTGTTTFRRTLDLHGRATGELFLRWLASLVIGLPMCAAVWGVFSLLALVLIGEDELTNRGLFVILLPASVWLVYGFFAVARFLCYLDLRIRSEGWEIELLMRTQAARIQRQPA